MAAPRLWTSTRRRVFKYRKQTFWAENGLCHIVDEMTGEYKVNPIAEFVSKARAFNAEAFRGRDDKQWIDERDELTRMVQDMIVCARQAQQQGDPFDPRAVRHMANIHKHARVSVPDNPTTTGPRRIIDTTGASRPIPPPPAHADRVICPGRLPTADVAIAMGRPGRKIELD